MNNFARDAGKRLFDLRRALGFSQNGWCKILGIKQPSLSNIENGHTRISISHALIIHERTGATLDWIYLGLEHGLPRSLAMAIAALEVQPVTAIEPPVLQNDWNPVVDAPPAIGKTHF
jgi:transcriptional regulator with XRE-family HTH domain